MKRWLFPHWIVLSCIDSFYLLYHLPVNISIPLSTHQSILFSDAFQIADTSILSPNISASMIFFVFCKIYIQWNTQSLSVPLDKFWQMHSPVHANSLSRYRTSTPTPESSLPCVYFYVFIFDKCMCPCNHHLNQDTEHFHLLRKLFYFFAFNLAPPHPQPRQPLISSVPL